jgi:hypothetical protein
MGSAAATDVAVGISSSIRDPAGEVVFQADQALVDHWAFTSVQGGEHTICFKTNTTRWHRTSSRSSVKLTFLLHTGADAVDYQEVVQTEHLTKLEGYAREVAERVKGIRAEQIYQTMREMEFRDTSEDTNSRVAWLSAIQLLVVALTGQYTLWYLKRFFRSKKLVH